MKQLVILSGKGGTGKTSVTAALAHLAAQQTNIVLADADVDAANLDLLLAPTILEKHDFSSGVIAKIDPEECISCGICVDVCRFDAIDVIDTVYTVDDIACDGCAACFYQCPVEAISLPTPVVGQWFRSDTRFGPLLHAHLFAGQDNSGKLVTLVKQEARLLALDQNREYVIVDGPPGIGCPVISAAAGADMALIVVEPTVSGVHDLARAQATTAHFNVPTLVAINKADINPARSAEIVAYCQEADLPLVGTIPFDSIVTEAMVSGQPITEYAPTHPVAVAMRALWDKVSMALQQRQTTEASDSA